MSWRVDSRSAWEARGAVCATAPTAGALRRQPLPVRDLDSVLKVGTLIVKQLSHKAQRKAKILHGKNSCPGWDSNLLSRQIVFPVEAAQQAEIYTLRRQRQSSLHEPRGGVDLNG